jgi:hypothetical protein
MLFPSVIPGAAYPIRIKTILGKAHVKGGSLKSEKKDRICYCGIYGIGSVSYS